MIFIKTAAKLAYYCGLLFISDLDAIIPAALMAVAVKIYLIWKESK